MSQSSCMTLMAGLAILSVAGAAGAQQTQTRTVEQATVHRPNGTMSKIELLKTGQKLETIKCRDFNMLAETYRPQAIVYAANYGPKGKAHPTVTTQGVARYVPIVATACRARPGDHFTTAVHNAMMPAR